MKLLSLVYRKYILLKLMFFPQTNVKKYCYAMVSKYEDNPKQNVYESYN